MFPYDLDSGDDFLSDSPERTESDVYSSLENQGIDSIKTGCIVIAHLLP